MSYQSDNMAFNNAMDSLSHYGVKGMEWGKRNEETLRKYGLLGGSLKTSLKTKASADEKSNQDEDQLPNTYNVNLAPPSIYNAKTVGSKVLEAYKDTLMTNAVRMLSKSGITGDGSTLINAYKDHSAGKKEPAKVASRDIEVPYLYDGKVKKRKQRQYYIY